MSSISTAVQPVLQAHRDATQAKIDAALLGKQINVLQETGDAIRQMIGQIQSVQKQLESGHIDVRV